MKFLNLIFAKIFLSSTFLISQTNYSSFVNPFIGTGGHGHTFPGAVMPFGMVQLSPDTRADASWDGSSGYHYSDTLIHGFSHTHLSGTGVSDWGDILVMPFSGLQTMSVRKHSSGFSHQNEKASPGYYEVILNKGKIKTELTVTPRVGIHRYTFQGDMNLVVDLLHRDEIKYCDMKVVDSVTVYGIRISKGWAKEQHVYFVMKFSKPIKNKSYASGKNPALKRMDASTTAGASSHEGAVLNFGKNDGKALMVKVAISAVSNEGARRNMEAEAQHWDFEKYKSEAEMTWNAQLQKVEIEENNADKLSTFYTALYHCFIHPSLNMDVDFKYRGRDNLTHTAEGYTNYSVFSLWDTYRALHPLLSILEPKRTADFINSFLHQYKQSGRLPVWELSSNETDCMIGFHSVSVIADALVKGIGGFDTLEMYNAMKAASNYTGFGIPEFNKKGFLETQDENESVSRSLEYAYDNWCMSQVARLLKKADDVKLYSRRAQSFRHLFDENTGFMRPRRNGNWLQSFDPTEVNNHFTEANSWQYSFYVPHDINGLMDLYGGKDKFEQKLDQLFNSTEKLSGREQPDVTGLIGQYAHGNEPSHHIAYLYNFVGKPGKTTERVKQIQNDFYKNAPDGLIGNEDCGQMSAWYVFSALGMYPVCPGTTQYVLSEPLHNKATINLDNGKQFTIERIETTGAPLKQVLLNNSVWKVSAIDHKQILNGGTLGFDYRNETKINADYGVGKTGTPVTFIDYPPVVPAPIIKASSGIYKDTIHISMDMINTRPLISVYTLDGSEPGYTSKIYNEPFVLDSSCTIKARVLTNGDMSPVTTSRFIKVKNNAEILSNTEADNLYRAEGALSLIDGIRGSANWRKGDWLGFQGQDFECVIDLKELKVVNSVSLGCLQETESWIFFPSKITIQTSADNKTFMPFGALSNPAINRHSAIEVKNFGKKALVKTQARYIKIKAQNFGRLPNWHESKGSPAWLFVDEIEIK